MAYTPKKPKYTKSSQSVEIKTAQEMGESIAEEHIKDDQTESEIEEGYRLRDIIEKYKPLNNLLNIVREDWDSDNSENRHELISDRDFFSENITSKSGQYMTMDFDELPSHVKDNLILYYLYEFGDDYIDEGN